MCRYILATPQNAADTQHSVRVIFGNGLRPQIWPQFIKRFQIPQVAEFYGATEGNANIGKHFGFLIHFVWNKKFMQRKMDGFMHFVGDGFMFRANSPPGDKNSLEIYCFLSISRPNFDIQQMSLEGAIIKWN